MRPIQFFQITFFLFFLLYENNFYKLLLKRNHIFELDEILNSRSAQAQILSSEWANQRKGPTADLNARLFITCQQSNIFQFPTRRLPFSLSIKPPLSLSLSLAPETSYRCALPLKIAAGTPRFAGDSYDMVSPEATNWLYEYGLIEDIPAPDSNFANPNSGFAWTPMQALNSSPNVRY